MFGVGFSEIVLIAIMALIVVGPERLPEIGKYLGKALRAWNRLKDDFTVKMHHIADTGAMDRESPITDTPTPAMQEPQKPPPVREPDVPSPGEKP